MAKSVVANVNAYLPYDKGSDILQHGGTEFEINGIPESADSPQPDFANLDLEDYQKAFEINSIVVSFSVSQRVQKLTEWIQYFRGKDVIVDVDRILRFAIYTGRNDLVTYLIDHEEAKLEKKDILNRTAIFYAAGSQYLSLLGFVLEKMNAEPSWKGINDRDVLKATPLYYAALRPAVSNVEFLLAAGAAPDDTILEATSGLLAALGKLRSINVKRDIKQDIQQMRLLFLLYNQLNSFRGFPIYAEGIKSSGLNVALFLVHHMQNDPDIVVQGQEITWIHVPGTNGVVLFAVFRHVWNRIQAGGIRPDFNFRQYLSFFLKCFRDPPTVPGISYLNYRVPTIELETNEWSLTEPLVAIVFPCITLQDMKSVKASRRFHRKLMRKAKWYVAKKLIQTERTLDEAYYPSLDERALEIRNNDQVVTRECRMLLTGERVSDDTKPILMIPQLWIWKFEDHIISAYACPGKSPDTLFEHGFDLESRYSSRGVTRDKEDLDKREWKNDHLGVSTEIVASGDLFIGLLLAQHIDKFGRSQANRFQSPLDIFEIGVVQAMSSVEKYMASNASAKLDIQKEAKFMHRIFDIRSELAMVKTILDEQATILKDFITRAEKNGMKDDRWKEVLSSQMQIENYCDRLKKIDGDAERIEKRIQDQLNLKRTYASIQDTRTSLLLGTAVIGFTIITIIFTPLSFMTSLFSLPIDVLAAHKNGTDGIYSTSYIRRWFTVAEIVSLVVTALLVVLSVWLLVKREEREEEKSKQPATKKTMKAEAVEDYEEEQEKIERKNDKTGHHWDSDADTDTDTQSKSKMAKSQSFWTFWARLLPHHRYQTKLGRSQSDGGHDV